MAKIKKLKKNNYKSRYTAGGIRNMYQAGGMYADNTVASAGQSMPSNTSSIVYQESDPRIQEERVKGMQSESDRLRQETENTAERAENIIEQGDMQADIDAANVAQKTAAEQGMAVQGATALQAGLKGIGVGKKVLAGASTAAKALKTLDTAKAFQQGLSGTKDLIGTGAAFQKGLSGAKDGLSLASTASTASKAAQGLSIGSKIGKFAASGAGIGLIGAGLGYGVKKAFGDDDPTTADFGSVAGSALSMAGTGASLGSFLGPIGTVAGGVIGGLYGGISSFFGSRKAKRAQEKAKKEAKRKQTKAITKSNKSTMKSFGSQLAAVRAGETAQKTYSGYDLGRNVTAQMGGMRMGMPRYGAAA
tara:strand:+ start:9934 stop:11019 length:1086 start_codon:yes stop_codon:yes gene_type:complete